MNRRPARRGAAGAGLSLLCLALLLGGCGQPVSDPEARVREVLAEAQAAAESGDFDALASWVARDYADQEGRDRRTLLLTLRGVMMRYPQMKLHVTVREIEILSPQLARARVEVLAAGAGPGGVSADAFPVELSLRDEGAGWKVTRAEWGRRFRDGI